MPVVDDVKESSYARVRQTDPPVVKEKRRWREWLIPRSILGMVVLLLAFAIGMAFSGAIAYSYYEYRLTQNESRTENYVRGFRARFETATKTIDAERENAKAEIQKELEPLKKTRAEGQTLAELVQTVGPSVWFVETQDDAGQPSVGSAFAVDSDGSRATFVTSFVTIKAATRTPAPQIFLRKGDERLKATLQTWDESKDLALLILDKGNIPKLKFAPTNPPMRTGDRIFAVSGLGTAGGSVTQGFVSDVSKTALQHDVAIGQSFQGGPVVNSNGDVVGVASRAFAPLGFVSDGVHFSPPIRLACEKILKCPAGDVSAASSKP